jgi:hypothetical protein
MSMSPLKFLVHIGPICYCHAQSRIRRLHVYGSKDNCREGKPIHPGAWVRRLGMRKESVRGVTGRIKEGMVRQDG